MRQLALSLFGSLFFTAIASSQTVITTAPTKGPGGPMYRPILMGSGPSALINRIDAQDLMKKGQKDAAIMFVCTIKKTGEIAWSGTYRGTPDSKLLEEEVQKRLAPASDTKFIPAIYNRVPVDAIYYGTVLFAVIGEKPRLRIFSNQEAAEITKESDFIGPQPFFGNESKFTGLHYPSATEAPVRVDGAVELKAEIDADGTVRKLTIGKEEPPFLGFGDAAIQDFARARFIPAFREGKAVPCSITLPVYYKRTSKGISIG
jgi:TonB family protein